MTQLKLPASSDITAANHKGNTFSVAANKDAKPRKVSMRNKILEFLKESTAKGLYFSSDATEDWLCLAHQSASARFTELHADGFIVSAGQAMTRQGSMADIFRAETDPDKIREAHANYRARKEAEAEKSRAYVSITSFGPLDDGSFLLELSGPSHIRYTQNGVDAQLKKSSLRLVEGMTNVKIEALKPRKTKKASA
jgi:hypothetical protein